MGAPCLVIVLLCINECSFLFAIILSRKSEHDALLSLFGYDKCSVAVPRGAMGLSEVCNCGTS